MIKWTRLELELLKDMHLGFDAAGELTDEQLHTIYRKAPEFLEFRNGEPIGRTNTAEDVITDTAKEMEARGLL